MEKILLRQNEIRLINSVSATNEVTMSFSNLKFKHTSSLLQHNGYNQKYSHAWFSLFELEIKYLPLVLSIHYPDTEYHNTHLTLDPADSHPCICLLIFFHRNLPNLYKSIYTKSFLFPSVTLWVQKVTKHFWALTSSHCVSLSLKHTASLVSVAPGTPCCPGRTRGDNFVYIPYLSLKEDSRHLPRVPFRTLLNNHYAFAVPGPLAYACIVTVINLWNRGAYWWDLSATRKRKWATTWHNQQCGCAPSEYSDQPACPRSLISLHCAL